MKETSRKDQAAIGKLLIIDDNPVNLGLVVEHLEEAGYELLVALDGEEALKRAAYSRPDLILLDVMMPGIDGFKTCRRLKADAATADIPVIFMTALDDLADKVAGFQAGGVDYVSKPFQPEELLARVRTHRAFRRAQFALAERNNALETPLECLVRGKIMPPRSMENSHGIDPDHRRAGALVRWRRILGSPSRSLVTNRRFRTLCSLIGVPFLALATPRHHASAGGLR